MYYNDWDKYAVKTYNKNCGTSWQPTDVTTINPNTIPKHVLICAGFPCQSFSIAGKRGGFLDTRGTMFFEICRIAKHCRTPYLLLENVKGLLSHDNGWTFATILNTLDELGYDAEWQVLNSKFFGVPQNRERVFIIANLRNEPRPEVFPITKDAGTVSEILEGEEGDIKMIGNVFAKGGQAGQVFDSAGISKTLVPAKRGGSAVMPIVVSPAITTENAHGYGNHVTVGQTEAIARCLDANMHKGVTPKGFFEKGERNLVFQLHNANEWRNFEDSPTLSQAMGTGGNNVPMVMDLNIGDGRPNRSCLRSGRVPDLNEGNNRLRRLTPKECERLQGFPDDWTAGVSDTQRYKQCGNSVTVNVIEEIAKRLNKNV